MELRQEPHGHPSLVSLFTFVARDLQTLKAVPINPLQPSTSEEVQLFNERQAVADSRRLARLAEKQGKSTGQQLDKQWADGLVAEGRAKLEMPSLASPDAVLMQDVASHNIFVCQPQQRNMHGRVFGGFLMR